MELIQKDSKMKQILIIWPTSVEYINQEFKLGNFVLFNLRKNKKSALK